MFDVVSLARLARGAAGLEHHVSIIRMKMRVEGVDRAGELVFLKAKNPVGLARPRQSPRSIELRHPAADVRDLLRPLEQLPALLQRPLGSDRAGDVAIGDDPPGDAAGDAVGGHEPFEDAAVPEVEGVARLAIRRRLPERLHSTRILEQPMTSGQDRVEAVAGQFLGGQVERLQVRLVVAHHLSVDIEKDDGSCTASSAASSSETVPSRVQDNGPSERCVVCSSEGRSATDGVRQYHSTRRKKEERRLLSSFPATIIIRK